MSFFGLTLLGDQNPFRDRTFPSAWRKADAQEDSRWDKLPELPPVRSPRRLACTDTCSIYNQPVPFSADVRGGAKYKEETRWVKTSRSPKQLYRVPFTENQKYGWWLPTAEPQTHNSWIKVRRFPRKNSEMTKFVKEMSMTNRQFSLF